MDDCKESLCAMQDCIVIDITKKQLEELCLLLRWKCFGIGAANRLLAFVSSRPVNLSLKAIDFRGYSGLQVCVNDLMGLRVIGWVLRFPLTLSPAHVVLSGMDAMGQVISDEEKRTKDVRIVPYNWAESFRFGSGAMGLEVLAGIRVQIVQGANKVLGEGMLPLDQVFAKLDHDGYLRHVVHMKNEAGEQGVERENRRAEA